MTSHSAAPSFLGYAFQPLHALLRLLRTQDDEAFIRLEVEDDVTLGTDNEIKELVQVKHTSKPLGYKTDDFWKTLKIWLDYRKENKEGSPIFVLVTISPIVKEDPIKPLAEGNISQSEIIELDACLKAEAERVCAARTDGEQEALHQKSSPKGTTYNKRIKACEAYIETPEKDRQFLLSRISIAPLSTPIQEIEEEVEKELMNYSSKIRKVLATRTIEWWSRISLESVFKQGERNITKDRLTEYLTTTASGLITDTLIDDMRTMTPPELPPFHPIARKQLELIDAEEFTILYASRVHWLAREQRSKWTTDNPTNAERINAFDQNLEDEWKCKFGEVCPTPLPEESSKKAAGKKMLDWSFNEAHQQVPPIREGWSDQRLVKGSYQILASTKRVGWHPKFKEKLEETGDDSNK